MNRSLSNLATLVFAVIPISQLLAAAPQLVGTPTITYSSYSNVRLAWQTDIPSSGIVLYGATTSYGQVTPAPTDAYVPNFGYDPQHSWFITGLAPGTTFHYCIQSTDQSGNSSVCNGIVNDFTFTTPAAPIPVPQPPQPPLSTVDISEPTQTGHTFTVNATSNCSDPSAGLQATLNAANLGDTIVIPHGTVCDGVYTFPAKSSGSGWIVVKSDGALPPDGTRITPSYLSQMATIRTSRPVMTYDNSANIPNDVCYGGVLIQELDAEGQRPGLHTCIASQNRYSTALPYTSGTVVPTSCTEGNLFYNTATAASLPYESTYQCVNDSGTTHFVPFYQDYDGSYQDTAAIQFAPGANHYRLIGLEVTFPPLPSTYSTLGGGVYYGSLVSLPSTSYNIVLDRLYVHGQDFPAEGPNGALYFEGANQALINSYLNNISYWQPAINPEHVTSAIIIQYGPGPGRIQNNYISAIGITLNVTEPWSTSSSVPSDYQVFGNYFYKDDKYRLGSPTNLSLEGGRAYGNRHSLELKQGSRWVVEGNIFDGNFAAVNQGASVNLTTSPADTGTTAANNLQINDIAFSSNIFMNSPQGFILGGTYTTTTANGSTGVTPAPKTLTRVKIDNNLFYELSSSLVVNPSAGVTLGNAIPFTLGYGMEDLRFSHNTSFCNSLQNGPLASFFSAPMAEAGLALNDNVACYGVNSGFPGVTGEGDSGTAAFNTYWQAYPASTPAWQFTNNVIYGDPTPGFQTGSGSPYPIGNFWPGNDAAVGFNNAPAMDFSLSTSSPYKDQASDGTDPGVDMVRLTAATTNTISGVNYVAPSTTPPVISGITISNLGQSGATVSWNTDVTSDTQVVFGPNGNYGYFSGWNPTLALTHSVALTNLTAGTTYHYQVRSSNSAGNLATSTDQTLTTVSSAPATVLGVSSATPNGTYGSTSTVMLTITFSKSVTVTGVPQLALNSTGVANYSTGSGTSVLSFVYAVAAGQSSTHLDYLSTAALALNNGTINDAGGVPANLTLNLPGATGSLGANASIVIDTTPPAVVSYSVLFGSQSYNLSGTPRNRLPWQITGIKVVFSKPIATGDLKSLSGVTATALSGLGTNTLTWTISPLSIGSFPTVLAGSGSDVLKDVAGNALAGGAGFSQTVKVLWADFNDDGVVNSQDQVLVNAAKAGQYNIFADLNGDGVVNANDVLVVRGQLGTSLP